MHGKDQDMVSNKTFVGVDPGTEGGLVVLSAIKSSPDVGKILQGMLMPITFVDGKASLAAMKLYDFFPEGEFIGVLEQVGVMPKQGIVSAFQFGRLFGAIETMLDCTANEIVYVRPQRWKKYFDLLGTDKMAAINKASEIFGVNALWTTQGSSGRLSQSKNSGLAEAALIALWGKRHYD